MEVKHINGRAFGVITLVIFIGLLFPYGFNSTIYNQSNTIQASTFWLFNYILVSVLAILGFGLLLTYFKFSVSSSFAITMIITAYTTLICPLLLKFWFNVLINGFDNSSITVSQTFNPNQQFYNYHEQTTIQLSYYVLRQTLFSSIGQLVLFTTIMGKFGLFELTLISSIFNVFWTFCLVLNIEIQRKSPEQTLFDDYFISNIYVFSGIFGIITSLFLRKPKTLHQNNVTTRQSSILCLLGTFFVFLAFGSSSALFPVKSSASRGSFNIGVFNSFFALSSCIVTTIGMNMILFEGFLLKTIIYGTLAGGVISGSLGNTVDNLAYPITVGLGAGVINAFYYKFVYMRINRNSIYDSLGMNTVFFINAFVSSIFITPIVISSITTNQINLISSGVLSKAAAAGNSLIYFALSLVFGGISGLLCGLVHYGWSKLSNKYFTDNLLFDSDFGLLLQQQQADRQKIKTSDSNNSVGQTANNLNPNGLQSSSQQQQD